MRKLWSRCALAVCMAVMALGMTVSAEEATILNGVMIDKVDVSGMTKAEALAALTSYEEQLGEQSIRLGIGDNVMEVQLSELGVAFSNEEVVDEALGYGRTGNIVKRYKDQKDLQHSGKVYALSWEADEDTVRAYVEENCTQYDQEAKNASLSRENGEFHFVAGEQGLELDVDAAVSTIMDYLENGWSSDGGEETLTLATKVTEPEGSSEELAYVTDLLGSFTTSFSTSNANRRKNVNTGAEHINGTVLYPGEEFSTYEVVQPFTEANGYAMAGSYLNGEVVDSMGGGICQVSTTLYNAVIRAELEVTERSPHSMTVSYVELSEDAAIAGTYKDFKFVNSTDYPIYIEGYTTADRKITFNIYGKETRDADRTISFESVLVSKTDPTTVLTEDAGQGLGYKSVSSGRTGYVAELYKVVKVNGVETERTKVNKSTYKGSNRVVTYGTAGDPVTSENLRAAIAAQDEALADANIAPIVAANAAAAAQ
ncbi:MAG: VanW family protein [Eubacteriales bacterium]|nr:VanW family protein [Eubacteriales bacterium]